MRGGVEGADIELMFKCIGGSSRSYSTLGEWLRSRTYF